MDTLLPEGWTRPSGYSNGVKAAGETLFVAGQIGWDAEGRFHSASLADQTRQALENIVDVLKAGGAGPENIVRLTWYITDMEEYRNNLAQIGKAYREVIGSHYPAMSAFQVVALVEPEAKVEIEATAVLPGT